MRVNEKLSCIGSPCADVNHTVRIFPTIVIKPEAVKVVMISEAAPPEPQGYYYDGSDSLFAQTTVAAFNDAGVAVKTIDELVDMGFYFTTAVKCGKTGYGIETATIKECSLLLEKELALFPNVKIYMLMGDVAIRALNYIAGRVGLPRVIPAGSTYKIRGGEFYHGKIRVFPSYLQAGPSFYIEKSKRRMIAEDIAAAVRLL
jgi:uracil-DNA glycosylase